jgi:hypothetical protein
MNEIDFEAKLRADGYTEIETQDLQPRPAKGLAVVTCDNHR